MDGPFALVRDCLRAGTTVALATVVEADVPEGESTVLPRLGAKLVVRPNAEPAGSLGNDDLDRVVIRDMEGALEPVTAWLVTMGPAGRRGAPNSLCSSRCSPLLAEC